MTTTRFQVTGMHCRSCKRLIESVLADLPGVFACEVDDRTGLGSVTHDSQTGFPEIEASVADLGEYKIERA